MGTLANSEDPEEMPQHAASSESALFATIKIVKMVWCFTSQSTAMVKTNKREDFGFGLVLFGFVLYIPVNSYGHVRMVSSPNHTCTYFRL